MWLKIKLKQINFKLEPKKIFLCLFLSVLLFNFFGIRIFADENIKNINLNIDAKSALLMEASSGKILYEQNSHEKLPPASVTKIMTLLLIYDAINSGKIKNDDIVTVSDHAANMGGSQIFLEPNEQQTVYDLLKSIVIASANDAAIAMAEYIGTSEENFVRMMNDKAKSLGMHETNFVNACGLDVDGHETSANDIAIMSRELITKYPQVFDLTKIWMDNITHKTKRGETQFGLSNTNKLIKNYNGATGLKTGSTGKALYCISATAQRENMNLISVIMGAPSTAIRFNSAAKLLDYGFTNFKIAKGEPVGQVKGQVKIYKGEKDTVDAAIKNEFSTVIPKDNKKSVESEIKLIESINAPVKKNTKVGEIIYKLEDKEIGRSDLVATENIKKASLGQIIKNLFQKWFAY